MVRCAGWVLPNDARLVLLLFEVRIGKEKEHFAQLVVKQKQGP